MQGDLKRVGPLYVVTCVHSIFTIWSVKQLKQKETAMADNENVLVFIAIYGSTDAAWEGYDSVK